MAEIKVDPAQERDCCVLCGKESEYLKTVPVEKRIGYIGGAGQLCRDCFQKLSISDNAKYATNALH